MYSIREIAPQIFWVGGSDRRLQRFENMFPVPNGVSYNSYLIVDSKTALLDTVDSSISDLFISNIRHALDGRTLDYLVINHMEPDHCANIETIMRLYPNVKLVGNRKTFQFFSQYYTQNIEGQRIAVDENQELSLGRHILRFHLAPMVHWPEVMFTYEKTQDILFSADAFGTFGALSGNLFADEMDYDRMFLDESRRYYANIVGKYGAQVQAVLAKLPLDRIRMICPLHGPIWRQDIGTLLEKYRLWSTYMPEKTGVVLAYASMYGNTENTVQVLAGKLADRGVRDIRMYDVSQTHLSYIVADTWKYSHLVVASPTYNAHLYSSMEAFLRDLSALGLRNRKVAIIGNHTWASAALRIMQEIFSTMQDMEMIGTLDIRSSLKGERLGELDALADAIGASLAGT